MLPVTLMQRRWVLQLASKSWLRCYPDTFWDCICHIQTTVSIGLGGTIPYTSVHKVEIMGPRALWRRTRRFGRLLERRVKSRLHSFCSAVASSCTEYHRNLKSFVGDNPNQASVLHHSYLPSQPKAQGNLVASKITNKETITNKVTTGTKGGPRSKNIQWQLRSYTKMVPEPKVPAYKN